MAKCANCGVTILFGGRREGRFRFCNDDCLRLGSFLALADEVPADLLAKRLKQIQEGPCPKCGGQGPVDVHTSHVVWSIILLTHCESNPEICCRACGNKARLNAILVSSLVGWWGLPFGVIMTPVQLLRNLVGLFSHTDPFHPSAELQAEVRMRAAGEVYKSRRQGI